MAQEGRPKGEYLQYGGQAVVEGVMMRSPRFFSVACRAPDGRIVVTTEALEKTWIGRQKWLKWPFFRGSLALLDTMALGIRAMRFATGIQMDPAYGAVVEENAKLQSKKVQDLAIGGTMIVSLALGLFIFNYLPNLLAQTLQVTGASGTTLNLVTELLKVVIFLGYLYAIGQLPDVREVFKYHGAEHQAINAMEAEQPITVDAAAAQTRLHPRCGTSFAIVVLLVSLVIFTFVPRYPFGPGLGYFLNATVRFGVELLLLPLISGTAYEIIRYVGRHKDSALLRTLLAPGLASQYLTTRVPERKHLAVAVAALQAVVRAEEGDPNVGRIAEIAEDRLS